MAHPPEEQPKIVARWIFNLSRRPMICFASSCGVTLVCASGGALVREKPGMSKVRTWWGPLVERRWATVRRVSQSPSPEGMRTMYSLADSVEVPLLLGWKASMCQEMPSGVWMRCGAIVDTRVERMKVAVKKKSDKSSEIYRYIYIYIV